MRVIETVKSVFDTRKIIVNLATEDFKKRFVGSYFGLFWLFVQPIVTILIYYCVFQLGFKSAPPSGIDAPYVLWLIPGIVPWFYFNEAVNAGTSVLYDYSYLVKKVVFKITVLPIIKNISCFFVHMIFWLIMIAVFLLYGYEPNIYWLQTVYYSFCAFALVTGLTMLTSAINAFFKDMGQIVNIFLQFGMWITPIMWSYTMMGENAGILKLNPFFYISEGYRDSMLNGIWFWERPNLTLYFWIVTLIILVVGTKVFKKMKPHFADVL